MPSTLLSPRTRSEPLLADSFVPLEVAAGPSDRTVIVQFLENGVRHTIPEATAPIGCDAGLAWCSSGSLSDPCIHVLVFYMQTLHSWF